MGCRVPCHCAAASGKANFKLEGVKTYLVTMLEYHKSNILANFHNFGTKQQFEPKREKEKELINGQTLL